MPKSRFFFYHHIALTQRTLHVQTGLNYRRAVVKHVDVWQARKYPSYQTSVNA